MEHLSCPWMSWLEYRSIACSLVQIERCWLAAEDTRIWENHRFRAALGHICTNCGGLSHQVQVEVMRVHQHAGLAAYGVVTARWPRLKMPLLGGGETVRERGRIMPLLLRGEGWDIWSDWTGGLRGEVYDAGRCVCRATTVVTTPPSRAPFFWPGDSCPGGVAGDEVCERPNGTRACLGGRLRL
jgi:hypothetical protein